MLSELCRLPGVRRGVGLVLGVALGIAGSIMPAERAEALSSTKQLLSARVPSMCDNPPGTLVKGELPNVPGWVAVDLGRSKLGKLVKGDGKGAAATFHCSAGGIGWADHVVFYNSAGAIIGHFNTGVLGSGGSSRASVAAISIASRVVTVRVVAVPRKGDNDLWGSTGATLTFAYDAKKKQVTRRSTTYYTEKSTGKKLLSLVRAGKTKKAKALASAGVVSELKKLVTADKRSKKVRVTLDGCGGPEMWGSDYWWFINQFNPGERGCLYSIHRKAGAEEYLSTYLVVFRHPAKDKYWKKWYGYKFVGVAG